VDTQNPCRCERQAAAKQRAGERRARFVDAVALSAANEELEGMLGLGRLFAEEPRLGAPTALWERVQAAFPRLTGKQ
jgi:hypothetical protein